MTRIRNTQNAMRVELFDSFEKEEKTNKPMREIQSLKNRTAQTFDNERTQLTRVREREKRSRNHNFSSLAILLAMFLKPIDVPDMRLNRTPFKDKRGNLHTSISHETTESVLGSPCTQSRRNFSRCS